MAPVNSQQLLSELKEEIATIRLVAISRFGGQSDAILLQSPNPDSWSAIQCLEHLNSFGRFYLPAIGEAIEKAVRKGVKPKAAFKSGWFGAWFTRLLEPQANGFPKTKMSAPGNFRPGTELVVEIVLAEFIRQQESMEQLLVAASRVDLEKVRVPISMSKWIKISAGDTFGYLIAHIRRHILQAQRAIVSANMYAV
ncbi:DinB family protein [Chitinophaga sp. Cy-1792]|uniref:DinB family protein n=1 Tax=Chitinophaga sp. Cy-1792 TaxID=2608339 RepID=UPI00141D9CBC|nr:DinB family protein [Chitinophaga sp. Cy-1792]NIG52675.1 DinB family protein [Chitinophaga sp. Cy-1792]